MSTVFKWKSSPSRRYKWHLPRRNSVHPPLKSPHRKERMRGIGRALGRSLLRHRLNPNGCVARRLIFASSSSSSFRSLRLGQDPSFPTAGAPSGSSVFSERWHQLGGMSTLLVADIHFQRFNSSSRVVWNGHWEQKENPIWDLFLSQSLCFRCCEIYCIPSSPFSL